MRRISVQTLAWRTALVASILVAGLACTEEVETPADLVITNAQIFSGDGSMIDRGSIVIRDGRLEAVGSNEPTPSALEIIDADGRTVLPGLIDVHRHLTAYANPTSEAELRDYIENDLTEILESLLAAGLTTVMSPGDALPEILEIKQRLESGDLLGPRILAAGPVFTAPGGHPAEGPVCNGDPFCRSRIAVEVDDPQIARARVREVVEQGVDFIKVVIDRELVLDAIIDDAVFEAIASEAEALGVPLIVHAETHDDVMRAVSMGADKLVHGPPATTAEELEAYKILVQAGVPMATTVSWGSKEVVLFFGGDPEAAASYQRRVLDNIRYLLDNGVVIAFGTDSPPPLGLTEFMVEVRDLATVMTPREIIDAMTIDAARYLEIDDRLGSLEPGKIADLVIVDGSPLDDPSALKNVVVVVKDGEVVFNTLN